MQRYSKDEPRSDGMRGEGESLRERNKRQKLARIQQVAWDLFRRKGFDATTTHEIAEEAQIGTGTLFLYVKDKHELLLLVFYDALEHTIDEAFASIARDTTLIDELLYIFGFFFRLYDQDPKLSRAFIKELLFQGEGLQRQRLTEQVSRFLERLAQRVMDAQARGEVAGDVDALQASQNFFALYYMALTSWLGGVARLDEASTQILKPALELQVRGLLPQHRPPERQEP